MQTVPPTDSDEVADMIRSCGEIADRATEQAVNSGHPTADDRPGSAAQDQLDAVATARDSKLSRADMISPMCVSLHTLIAVSSGASERPRSVSS